MEIKDEHQLIPQPMHIAAIFPPSDSPGNLAPFPHADPVHGFNGYPQFPANNGVDQFTRSPSLVPVTGHHTSSFHSPQFGPEKHMEMVDNMAQRKFQASPSLLARKGDTRWDGHQQESPDNGECNMQMLLSMEIQQFQ